MIPPVPQLYSLYSVRLKIIFTICFLFAIVMSPEINRVEIITYCMILFIWTLFARPGMKAFMIKFSVLIPFYCFLIIPILFFFEGSTILSINIGVTQLRITDTGLHKFLTVFIKTFLSLYAVILLSTSDSMTQIFKGLRGIYFPKTLLTIVFITIRYIGVIAAQSRRMIRARSARSFNRSFKLYYKSTGTIIGSLFIRSIQRSQNVYHAMLARGFTGEVLILPDPPPVNQQIQKSRKICSYALGILMYLLLIAVKLTRLFNES